MKVIKVDFTKRGKDLFYLKKDHRLEQKRNIDEKLEKILAFQKLQNKKNK